MKLHYTLKEVRPRLFVVTFASQYDLAMMFCRAQEYYESECPKFHLNTFTRLEHMRWYAGKHGNGAFTYPDDYIGFNVPSWAIIDCLIRVDD